MAKKTSNAGIPQSSIPKGPKASSGANAAKRNGFSLSVPKSK